MFQRPSQTENLATQHHGPMRPNSLTVWRVRQELLDLVDVIALTDQFISRNEYWLKWFYEAGGGGSPDESRLEQTPYPFQPH